MRKEVITHQDPKSPISEIFKTLRTNIQFMSTKGKIKNNISDINFARRRKKVGFHQT